MAKVTKAQYKSESPLTSADCVTAFEKMTPDEQVEISMIMRQVITSLKAKKSGFASLEIGQNGALELIAKLGIFISQQEKARTGEQALANLQNLPSK